MNRRILFLLGFLFAVVTGACQTLVGNSPGGVVRGFYKAANEGRYSDAEQYLSTDTLTAIKGPLGQKAGGFKKISDDNTRNGQIKEIEITKEDIRGERATVYARIVFKDGQTKNDDVTELIKEKGDWKIALGGH